MDVHSRTSIHTLVHEPLHGLHEVEPGVWLSEGDDPQFIVSCGEHAPLAGIYRITAMLDGDCVSRPCIYLDFGKGWSESTRFELADIGGGRWSAVVQLPALSSSHRFDPSDRACRFRFGGLVLERLEDAVALLSTLREAVREEPSNAAEMVETLASEFSRAGAVPACGKLLRRELDWQGPDEVYAAWVERHERLSMDDRAMLHAQLDELPARPLLSLLLPLQEAISLFRLEDCVASLIAQIYPDWELLLACVPSQQDLASRLALRSSRIRVLHIDHGEQALTTLVSEAKGTLSAWIAGAPVLAEHALFAFANEHLAHPDAPILYSDGDRLDPASQRLDPWFRPQWNADLFLSKDFLAGVSLLETKLLQSVVAAGGDQSIEAINLRCIAACEKRPRHLPLLLWHQPQEVAVVGSPGMRLSALAAHLKNGGGTAGCEVTREGARVHWPLPDPLPKASLIIPTRDRVELLRTCVDSVLTRTTYESYEIVIVDNQSTDPDTLAYLDSLSNDDRVRIIRHDAPFNYSEINNRAVEQVDGEIVVLLNNDLEVITPGWLEELVSHAIRPGVGAVGAMLYYPDDTIQHAGVVLGLGGVAGHIYSRQPRGTSGAHGRAALVQDASAVTAACLAVRREVFLEVGGLDESLRVAFNDVDFCLRLLAHGYRNIWTPFAELYHHESATRGAEDTPEKHARFVSEVERMHETWGTQIADDPAYSPNLSLRHGAANVLADPPRQGLRHWLGAVAMMGTGKKGKQ